MKIKTIYQGKTPVFEILKQELGDFPIKSDIMVKQRGKYGVRFTKDISKIHFPHISTDIIHASDSIEDILEIMKVELLQRRWGIIDFERELKKREWEDAESK